MRVAEPALRRPRTRPVRLFGCLYKRKILIFYSTMRGFESPAQLCCGQCSRFPSLCAPHSRFFPPLACRPRASPVTSAAAWPGVCLHRLVEDPHDRHSADKKTLFSDSPASVGACHQYFREDQLVPGILEASTPCRHAAQAAAMNIHSLSPLVLNGTYFITNLLPVSIMPLTVLPRQGEAP